MGMAQVRKDIATTTFEASLVGIDISSGDDDTAACVLGLRDGRLRVHVEENVSDIRVDELIEAAGVTAIDAPFGWPTAFAEFAGAWMPPENLKQRLLPDWAKLGDGQPEWWRLAEVLKFRATDRYVRLYRRDHDDRRFDNSLWAPGFSVSADRLALPAMRTMRILQHAGVRNIDGNGEKVIEVYPGLALAEWHHNAKGYKDRSSAEARDTRAAIAADLVEDLRTRCKPRLADDKDAQKEIALLCERAAASPDVLDAFVCALNAWACTVGSTVKPTDDVLETFWTTEVVLSRQGKSFTEQELRVLAGDERTPTEVISAEGWIHHPTRSLEDIVAEHPWCR
jgi:predicted nuclease with RNAse H fold